MSETAPTAPSDDAGTPDEVPRSVEEVPPRLRELRARAQQPSFTEIARRVSALRTARGLPPAEAQVSRSTVYDCFRDGRRRFDLALVLDLVRVMRIEDDAMPGRWSDALERAQLGLSVAHVVSASTTIPTVDGFVGRVRERSGFGTGTAWISGMAGAGKSALARRVLVDLVRDGTVDSIVTIDLRGHGDHDAPADPSAVVASALRALGHRGGGHATPQSPELLRRLLADRRAALLLDDAADEEQVRDIVGDLPDSMTVIVTSRVVPSSSGWRHVPLGPLAPAESLDLLRLIAGRERIDADPVSAGALSHAAAHLPLALTLLAARLSAQTEWSLADHLERVRDRHEQLRIEDAVKRAFDSSYRALPWDARAIARLVACAPSAPLRAVDIAALGRGVVADVDAALSVLVSRSVLLHDARARHTAHALVRIHLAERASEEDPPSSRRAATARLTEHVVTEAWARHHLFMRSRGEIPRSPRSGAVPAPNSIEARTGVQPPPTEDDGIELALLIAASATDDAAAIALSEALNRSLQHAGRYEDALALAREAGERARVSNDVVGRRRARLDAGTTLAYLGRYAEAEIELLLAEEIGHEDPADDAAIQNALAGVLDFQGRAEQAEERYRAALTRAVAAGDVGREGVVWSNLARLHGRAGRLDLSRRALDRAVDASDRAGDATGAAVAAVNLSRLSIELGDAEEGERGARAALQRFEQLGMIQGIIVSLSNLGDALQARGRPEAALPHLERGLEEARAAGMRQHEMEILLALARTRMSLGDALGAEEAARSAHDIAGELGDAAGLATAAETIAHARRARI